MSAKSDHHRSNESIRDLVKINDLPLYPEKISESSVERKSSDGKAKQLEESIRSVRQVTAENLSFLSDAIDLSQGYYHHGIGHAKRLYANFKDEKEQTTKIAVIVSMGLLGLFRSRKKGIFKKLFYTSLFSGTAAAFCFPVQAKEYRDISCYITQNNILPVVKEYTGIDLNEQAKSFSANLPDFTYLKTLWNENTPLKRSSVPTRSTESNNSTKEN